jgi:hypothetical protein
VILDSELLLRLQNENSFQVKIHVLLRGFIYRNQRVDNQTPHKALNLASAALVVSTVSRLSAAAGFLGRSGRFVT